MVNKFNILLVVIYALGFLSSCSTWQALKEPPKVDVKSIDISSVGLKGIDLNVNLKILNPNGMPLTIDKLKYDLSIGDSSLFKGVFNKSIELKAKETSIVTIPIHLNYENSKTAVENYLFKAVRNYKFTGEVTSGLITIPIKDEGKINSN